LGFQGVFFDIDGTLVGLRPAPEVVYEEICQEYGLGCSKERIAQARQVALSFVGRHGLEFLGDESAMWHQANRRVFLHLGAGDRAAECSTVFQERFGKQVEEFPLSDVIPTLEGLQQRGYLLGALTGRLHSSEDMLIQIGLRPFFEFYLYAGELGVLKPDPRMYREALKRARLSATAVVLVGDNAQDVKGARSVDMTPVIIARDGQVWAEKVRHITDLRDLLGWLDRNKL
jgi:HAD superfamily hydrolase (TIGR01509 family)